MTGSYFKKKFFVSNRIGVGFLPGRGNDFIADVPWETNFLVGSNRHFFEIGFGISYMYWDSNYWLMTQSGELVEIVDQKLHLIFITGRIGYRYQNPKGGFFFNAGFTPLLQVVDKRIDKYDGMFAQPKPDYRVLPWAGIGIGYTLKCETKFTPNHFLN